MKRSLILGVTLVAVLLLSSFVTPSMANDTEHKIEDESKQEIITEQITMVCYSAPPVEVEPVVVSEPPEIEENDEAYDGIEEESKEEETYITHYTEDDIIMLAKLLYNECRGVDSVTEQACVVWTVLNRVDHGGISIAEAITSPNQFAYSSSVPVWDNLYWLAEDVLSRWNAEQNGDTSVGRVLPPDYRWFGGDGKHNHFRNAYDGDYQIWDYSLESPYES